jgi:excisionase family DNA binding protein
MEKELLKVEEAAEVLSISVRRMYELIAAREIRSVKLGRVRRVPVAAVNEFVERLNAESGSLAGRPDLTSAGDGNTAA